MIRLLQNSPGLTTEGASEPSPQYHGDSPLVVNIGIFQPPETVKQHDKNNQKNVCFALVCMENTLKILNL